MRTFWLLLLACWLVAAGAPASAQTIDWRVSVKFILDANGNRPADTFANKLATDAEVQAHIDYGNWVLARSGRGYRLRLTEIVNVANRSTWFNIDATGDGSDADTDPDPRELRDAALASFNSGPNAFRYDPAAINVYIVNGNSAGSCPCSVTSPVPGDLIVLSQGINPDWVILHESAHFLGLRHTQNGERELNANGSVCTNGCACAVQVAGEDSIADTLPDHSCWSTADRIATNNFNGRRFAQLTLPEQTLVNNTLSNIMSYHGNFAAPRDPTTGAITGPADRSVLTSDQLDVMTDYSNGGRSYVASGRTWFVDRDNNSTIPDGNSRSFEVPLVGPVGGPFKAVADGVTQAGANDIVLIRPGTYTDSTRFAKALTLRATRGNAVLRAP